MSGRVCRVYELAGDEAVRGFLCQLVSLCDRAGHALGTFGQNQLRAVSLEHIAALDGHGFRHGQDDVVAAGRRNSRQTDTGVAGGRLDDGRARLECAGSLGLIDHCVCDTVLDRTGRIEILELGENGCVCRVNVLSEFLSRIQRGVADQISEALFNIRHGVYRLSKFRKIKSIYQSDGVQYVIEISVSTSAHSPESHSSMPPF